LVLLWPLDRWLLALPAVHNTSSGHLLSLGDL
jgi:hypothetical protein